MSDHLAIATVTAGLGRMLDEAVIRDLPGVTVKVSYGPPPPPSNNGPDTENRLHVFLYHTSPNGTQWNTDLPTRSADGRLVARPQVALDLHYLLTFHGVEAELIPHRMMGSVVRTLEAEPVLTRRLIEEVRSDAQLPSLADADLGNALETVKFTPEPLSLEEMSKLWSIFFQTPYTLSVAYRASVVLIDGPDTPQPVRPVQTRSILVMPSMEGATRPLVTPDQLPDLRVWLKSDAGVTYNSEGVSKWDDQSGNGHHASQTEPASKPAFVAHGVGNKPVVRFDGTDDYLAIEKLAYSVSGDIGEITVCALVRSESKDPQIIASFDRSEYWRLALKDGTDQNVGWDTTDATGSSDDLRSKEDPADGRWHLICGWFKAGELHDKRILVDGVEVKSATAHGVHALGTGVARIGFVGVGSEAETVDGATGPNWFLHGDLAELLIFHHALSDEERGELERYFVDRYRK